MKKFILPTVLFIALFAGCSDMRTEEITRDEYMPTRSRIHVPAEVPVEIAENKLDVPFDRNRRPRRSSQNVPNTSSYGISSEASIEFSSHLAHHQTTFDTADKGRETNITLAAGAINGAVIKPGETFSFNETIGSTTEERGYKKAVIFRGGEKAENFGGGVCQVSTTLCNAAMSAGMTIVERHDHSLPVNYAESGKEAATSQNGKLDFKFKNEKQHDIIIHSKAENGTISVTIVKS
ncbi:MAG: VanW family protein [Defluviitaleaceae bacterium]|nr:VanW family protein [Defluviitaleaceae bacterium]